MRNYSEVTAPIRGIGPENKIWHDHMDDWFRTQKNCVKHGIRTKEEFLEG